MPRPSSNARCSVPDCDATAIVIKPEPLCRKHDKRKRRGRPLVDGRPAIGSPSGHGQYGVLDDDGLSVMCHECGKRVRSVGNHLTKAHDMTAREYRLTHGLRLTQALTCTAERERASASALAHVGGASWRKLEAARDPAAASAARTPESLAAIGRAPGLAERAAANGRTARLGRVHECPVCGATWCPLPDRWQRKCCSPECVRIWRSSAPGTHRLAHPERDAAIYAEHRSGIPRAETAERYGITSVRVGQIVRLLGRR